MRGPNTYSAGFDDDEWGVIHYSDTFRHFPKLRITGKFHEIKRGYGRTRSAAIRAFATLLQKKATQ